MRGAVAKTCLAFKSSVGTGTVAAIPNAGLSGGGSKKYFQKY